MNTTKSVKSSIDRYVDEATYTSALGLYAIGRYEEAKYYLQSAVNSASDKPSRRAIDAWILYLWCLRRVDDGDECMRIANILVDSNLDEESYSRVDAVIASLDMRSGAYERANDTVARVIEIVRYVWQPIDAELLLCRGCALLRLGEHQEAVGVFEQGYHVAGLQEQHAIRREFANYIAVTHNVLGNYEVAIRYLIRELSGEGSINDTLQDGYCLQNLGIAYYKLGVYNEGLTSFSKAQCIFKHCSDWPNLSRTHIALANVHRLTRNFPDARKHLTQAYSMATDLKIPREECLSLEFLGDVYRDEGKPEEARRYYQRGMAIARAIAPEGDLVMELLRREGECLVLEGKPGEGLEILARARTHARKLGDRFEEGVTLRCLAEGMLRTADHVQALRYAEEAASQLESIDARHEHAIARLVAADILLDYSREPEADAPRDLLDQAWEHTLVAQPICRALEIEYWDDRVKRLQSRIARRRAEEARYAIPKAPPAPGDEYKPGDIIIAESRAMHEVMQAVEAFSPCDEPLLLTGETGTGKEVIAKRIHQLSLRKDKPFVAVNVTAIPHTMFEREFFGHTRGAFSGADHDRSGLAAEADGGTLFLDEIGDLAPATQAKLLRLLQDGSYLCLGDPVERRADLRVIAATNLELESAVADGRFREDLYYRLAILAIPLPPLRSRPEDIRPLLDHFLSLSAGRRVSADGYFNELSLKLLEKYGWPGNAREVALVARRAHITKQTYGRVEIEVGSGENAMVLTGHDRAAAAQAGSATSADSQPLSRARILLALEEAGGNRSKAARSLGVSRATFYRRLEKYDLEVD